MNILKYNRSRTTSLLLSTVAGTTAITTAFWLNGKDQTNCQFDDHQIPEIFTDEGGREWVKIDTKPVYAPRSTSFEKIMSVVQKVLSVVALLFSGFSIYKLYQLGSDFQNPAATSMVWTGGAVTGFIGSIVLYLLSRLPSNEQIKEDYTKRRELFLHLESIKDTVDRYGWDSVLSVVTPFELRSKFLNELKSNAYKLLEGDLISSYSKLFSKMNSQLVLLSSEVNFLQNLDIVQSNIAKQFNKARERLEKQRDVLLRGIKRNLDHALKAAETKFNNSSAIKKEEQIMEDYKRTLKRMTVARDKKIEEWDTKLFTMRDRDEEIQLVYEKFDEKKADLERQRDTDIWNNRSAIEAARLEMQKEQDRAYNIFNSEAERIDKRNNTQGKLDFLSEAESGLFKDVLLSLSVFLDDIAAPNSSIVPDFGKNVPPSLKRKFQDLKNESKQYDQQTQLTIDKLSLLDIKADDVLDQFDNDQFE